MTSNVINTFIRPLEVGLGSRMNLWLENPAKIRMLREQGREATTVFAGLFRYLDEVMEYTKLAFRNEDDFLLGAMAYSTLSSSSSSYCFMGGASNALGGGLSGLGDISSSFGD